jgi:predicted PurR-regulated permease PerM
MIATRSWQRCFVFLGSLVLVVAGLYWAQKLLIPIVLAILLAFVLSPLVSFLQRFVGRVLAAIAVVLLTFVLLAGIGWGMAVQIKNLVAELPTHREEIRRKIQSLEEAGRHSWLDDIEKSVQELLETMGAESAKVEQNAPAMQFQMPGLKTLVIYVASPALEALVYSGLVIILAAFMLIHREKLRNRVIRLFRGSLTGMTRALDDATQRISRFLLMQAVVNGTYGIVVALGLYLIGVPYAPLCGFLVAILRYIPYVGIWVAGALPLLLSIIIMPSWTAPLLVIVLIAGIELAVANIVEPLVYGQSIGVSEVALLISAAFWGWLWGPFGLVLSIPLTACLVVLGRYVPQLEFFSILMGAEPMLEPYVTWYQRLLARDEEEATELVEQFQRQHTTAEMHEQVLLPGLALVKRNRERGELTAADEQRILQIARDNLEEFLAANHQAKVPMPGPTSGAHEGAAHPAPLVIGCPAQDKADELGLHMFRDSLPRYHDCFEVMSSDMLLAEMVAHSEKSDAPLILIATLSAAGIPHARHLCKRLRSRLPELKILVACWECQDIAERTRKKLYEAGVAQVSTSFEETRQQLTPLVQFAANATAEAGGESRRVAG